MRRQLVAVHHRQADVEDRDVRAQLRRHLQRRRGVERDARVVAFLHEHFGEHLRRVFVVVDDEDAPACRFRPASRLPAPRVPHDEVSAARSATAGRRTTNSLPFPGPSLRADTEPPCSSTRLRTIVRPRPSPPCDRSSACRSCTNRSKMCGSISGGDADAGVLHRHLHVAVHLLRPHRDIAARRRVLRGVRQQVRDDLASRVGSPSTRNPFAAPRRGACASAARAAGSPSRSPRATTSAMSTALA